MSRVSRVLVLLAGLVWVGSPAVAADGEAVPPAAERRVDFAAEIWPILESRCLACHGPDDQQGRLRLDAPKIVAAGGISGPLYEAGKSEQSLLVQRLLGEGDADRMPLDDEPLSDEEIGLIRTWIDQGAVWPTGIGVDIDALERHWAYVSPRRPTVPEVSRPVWPRSPIDNFVLHQLDRQELSPSESADRERLLRRVTFDLIGLPPTPAELDVWLADSRPEAYERVVDRLLASPRYGEHWARYWLDAARFADSNGYQRDGRREIWAYRDWVIDALNSGMPFDQFTIEQLAGDLLPDAELSHRIATGFQRGTMANVEAGTDPEEERVLAIIDRVNTLGTVWLGTTLECAQCHNHKYDPFSQRDYYRLFAFYNNTAEEISAKGSNREFTGPKVPLPLPENQRIEREEIQRRVKRLESQVAELTKQLEAEQPQWEETLRRSMRDEGWHVLQPLQQDALGGTNLVRLPDGSVRAGGDFPGVDTYRVEVVAPGPEISAFQLEVLTDDSLPGGGPGRVEPGNFVLSEFVVEIRDGGSATWKRLPLASAMAEYSQPKWPVADAIDGNAKTGWAVAPRFGRSHRATFVLKQPIEADEGATLRFTLDQQFGNTRTIGRFRLLATSGDPEGSAIPQNVRQAVSVPPAKRSKAQKQELREFHLGQSKTLAEVQEKLTTGKQALARTAPSTTLVMQELDEPRTTHMLVRGDFLNRGEVVTPGMPSILHVPPSDEPANRLTLARWIVDEQNPLVSRVTVNRHWARFFGRGLVSTLEDFGTQSDPPSHPELLDWLATEFMRQGWDLKSLHRLIVTSATYQQSARATPELLAKDPDNRWYARGPRLRLDAEVIRDHALASAGLLSEKMHGPPVFPWQPAGVWNHVGRASNDWTTSTGEDRYRRGLYVYWRRTVPYPSFVNFDAPSREACTVQRSRSNTPLQALTLLNDPVYFEAAAALAARMLTEPGAEAPPETRAEFAFRLVTSRTPQSREVEVLVRRYREELRRYREDEQAANELIGDYPRPAQVEPAEYAAWIHVGNVLLNLDESITKG